MRPGIKSILFIILGIIVAFPLFSMTYYTMVRTSTPQFCSSCHEIEEVEKAIVGGEGDADLEHLLI